MKNLLISNKTDLDYATKQLQEMFAKDGALSVVIKALKNKKQNIYNIKETEMLIIELNKFPKDWYKIKECFDKGVDVNAKNKDGHILKDYVDYYTDYILDLNLVNLNSLRYIKNKMINFNNY